MRAIIPLLFIALSVHAELIPASRLIDWTAGTASGVPGGIPTTRTATINVTLSPYFADNTGVTECSTAIQSAIDVAYLTPGTIVYLPVGIYKCNTTLFINAAKDNITIRGAGMTNSIIRPSADVSYMFYVGSSADYLWLTPTTNNIPSSGVTKGSTNITIGDASPFTVGQMARIAFINSTNAALPVLGVGGGEYLRSQLIRITSKTSTQLHFEPPLYDNYTTAAKVNYQTASAEGIGIEDLTIDLSNTSSPFGIYAEQCYGTWIKNIKIIKPINYGIFLTRSSRCEIRGCWLNERKGSGSNGAGLLIVEACANLIEDNVIDKFFPCVEVNNSSAGNVFTYNTMMATSVIGIDSNHGPHNHFNLYEGNFMGYLQCDGYFGSASHDLVFRNWCHSMGPTGENISIGIVLNRFTRYYTIIGNLLGLPGLSVFSPYSFGNPNLGNSTFVGTASPLNGDWWADWGTTPGPSGFQELDLDVSTTVIRKANRDLKLGSFISDDALLGGDSIPDSYAHPSKPSFLAAYPWPPFDVNNPPTSAIFTNNIKLPSMALYFSSPSSGSSGPPAPTTNAPGGIGGVGGLSFSGGINIRVQ